MTKFSVVVPCFNEEDSLPLFFSSTEKVLQEMSLEVEYWFIDDGSTDRTLSVISHFQDSYENVHYVSFSRNFGKEAAMYAGFQESSGDYVVVMDADLQDPPELLPQMVHLLESGQYDCVGTRRIDRTGEGRVRSFFSHLFYSCINHLSDIKIIPDARDFRMMTRQMVNAILQLNEYNRFSKGIFSWVGFRTKFIDYHNVKRVAGKTDWSYLQLMNYAIDGIMSFSDVPLSLAIWIGLFFAILSFLGLIVIIIRHFVDSSASAFGWSSLACIILLMGGLQLLFIGIVGKYVGKTYMQSKRRPIYIVRKKK